MGCNTSVARVAAPVAVEEVGDVDVGAGVVHEDQIAIALKHKRRAENVFTESIDVAATNFKKKIVPKEPQTKAMIRAALESNFIFSTLNDEQKEDFINAMEPCSVSAGSDIITQGTQGDFFYVVERGTFAFIVDGVEVGSCKEGKSFGELALLYNTPRAATVRANADALVWSLDRQTFRYTLAYTSAKQKDDLMQCLHKVPLLQGLTEQQLQKIADAVTTIKFEPDQVIIQRGQDGNIFYMIQEGTVDVRDIGVGGRGSFADHELHAGDYFGERALLTGEPRAANVIAKTSVTLVALDRESFNTLLGPLRALLDANLNARAIQSVPLLSKLTKQEKDKLIRAFVHESFEADETIIRQGEPGNKFYIIKQGSVQVSQYIEDNGEVKQVAQLSTGDYFGELALLNDEGRKATVVALEDTEVFSLQRNDFIRLLGPLQTIIERQGHARMLTLAHNEELVQQHTRINFGDLRELAILGTGTFGRVKLVQHRENKNVYALKMMLKSEIVAHKQQVNVMNEKNVMMQCNHPFILRLYCTFKDSMKLYFLLEFVQGGELWSVLHTSRRDGVPVSHARFYGLAVFMALSYLHSKDIAYRDLKPENCLIDVKGYPKVADFGFAKTILGKTYTLCGTPEYLAPEIVLGRGHNKSVDLWAFGILLYEMIAGYSPFCDPENMDQIVICKNIVHGKLRFPLDFDSGCKDLVKGLLVRDESRRLGNLANGMDDIENHDFFASINKDEMLQCRVPAPWVPNVSSATDTHNFDAQDNDDHLDDGYVDTGDWDRDF